MATIRAVIVRNEPGSGDCQISSGFLLTPGLATEQTVRDGRIVVLVRGVEVASNVTALRGRHRDESLKSVLVQFRCELAQNEEVPATVIVGERMRRYADPAYIRPTHEMVVNDNAIVPSDPDYLCSCEMWRHLLPAGDGTASEEKFFTALASTVIDSVMSPLPADIYYDANYEDIHAISQLWMRTGAVRFRHYAVQYALQQLVYSTPNPAAQPPCLAAAIANPDGRAGAGCYAGENEALSPRSLGFATMYLLTGWRDWWGTTAFYAQYATRYWDMYGGNKWPYFIMPYGTHPRMNFREYGHTLAPHMVDATIPVNDINQTGQVKDWQQLNDHILTVLEDNAWDVHWIPFENATGKVPAQAKMYWGQAPLTGPTISQGAVTTKLLAVCKTQFAPCCATGSPMPNSGYFMVQAPSGGSFTAGPIVIGDGSTTAVATGVSEADYCNGIVGTRTLANPYEPAPLYQWRFPVDFLIDTYLYIQCDDRIPGMVKHIVDVWIRNMRAIRAGDLHYGAVDANWGTPKYVTGYLTENPPTVSHAAGTTPYICHFARGIAFVWKTIGDLEVCGDTYSTWYERCIDTGQIAPVTALDWGSKHIGQYYGWQQDAPWIAAQTDLLSQAPEAMRIPQQWNEIPSEIPDVQRETQPNPHDDILHQLQIAKQAIETCKQLLDESFVSERNL